ncbi:MAG: hypothetical protein L0H64_17185 [Pseudonocardia sp.]|nr:hypothetical protein [Pseudonocardia sp.]
MRPAQALSLARKLAREHDLTVVELKGRGKGSHRIYALVDSTGSRVARFGVTDHPRDLSRDILQRLEYGLEPWFGKRWTEKR